MHVQPLQKCVILNKIFFANKRGGVVLEKGNIIMCIKSHSHHINILLNVHIAGTYKWHSKNNIFSVVLALDCQPSDQSSEPTKKDHS